jgi:3alpha(or 20beta)-hydroxysteroid dehydrogenase
LDEEGRALSASIGDGAEYRRLDVRDETAWREIVADLDARFGRIDILVNNAGVSHQVALENIDKASAERVIGINLIGPLLGIAAVTPIMKRRWSGAIINTSSTDGLRGSNGKGAYAASKWGLRGLSKVAAIELGGHGIRVNSIHPGAVNTPMGNPRQVPVEMINEHLSMVPMHRMGKPTEIADLCIFLAGDEASYVSGAEIAIDGGWAAGYIQPAHPGAPYVPPKAGV